MTPRSTLSREQIQKLMQIPAFQKRVHELRQPMIFPAQSIVIQGFADPMTDSERGTVNTMTVSVRGNNPSPTSVL